MIDIDLSNITTELKVTRNQYGLMLTSRNIALAIAESFRSGKNYSPYYLKQLRPQKSYMTGLFKEKTKNPLEVIYRGKIDKYQIAIKVNESVGTATITYK